MNLIRQKKKSDAAAPPFPSTTLSAAYRRAWSAGMLVLALASLAMLSVSLSRLAAFHPLPSKPLPRSAAAPAAADNPLLIKAVDGYIAYEDYTVLPKTRPESAAAPVRSLKMVHYKVQPGETLGAIAARFGRSVGTLISFNSISDVRKVRSGSELQIPSADGIWYTVVAGDSLERIANRHHADINAVCDMNNLPSEVIRVGQKLFLPGVQMDAYAFDLAMGRLFRKPTVGRLSSGYGYRPDPFTGKMRMHNGIDIANRLGTPVVASMAGKVSWVDNRPKGYGNYVVVHHGNGYETLYAHLSRIDVKIGQWVEAGQRLGAMGSTGRSTGPHLHFTIFRNNVTLNPLHYVHYQ